MPDKIKASTETRSASDSASSQYLLPVASYSFFDIAHDIFIYIGVAFQLNSWRDLDRYQCSSRNRKVFFKAPHESDLRSFDLPQLYYICSYSFTSPYSRYNFDSSNSIFLSSRSKDISSPDIIYQTSTSISIIHSKSYKISFQQTRPHLTRMGLYFSIHETSILKLFRLFDNGKKNGSYTFSHTL
jgi:hypothetical protein